MMKEITTGILLLVSVLAPFGASAATSDKVNNLTTSKVTESITEHSITLESYVREYFKDTPILAEVSACESTFRQYNSKGLILRGEVNSDDVGLMQINTFYHEDTAKKLGYDIYTIEGNLAFGKYLYDKYGTSPWSASSKCWKKYSSVAVR